MSRHPKLFLYSLSISVSQLNELTHLVGKEPAQISFTIIENAADVITNSRQWLGGFREMLSMQGYQLEQVDLRNWRNKRKALHEKLASKDVIWIGGGHTYYLRWILKETGADSIIQKLVRNGKIYAGWSAGAVVAGPTTRFFDLMGDTPEEAPEVLLAGLHLTEAVIIPHRDNKDFAEGARKTDHQLKQAGYQTILLGDTEAVIINEGDQKILTQRNEGPDYNKSHHEN